MDIMVGFYKQVNDRWRESLASTCCVRNGPKMCKGESGRWVYATEQTLYFFGLTFSPYNFTSSHWTVSSKEPRPMRPQVKSLSTAVLAGFFMSS